MKFLLSDLRPSGTTCFVKLTVEIYHSMDRHEDHEERSGEKAKKSTGIEAKGLQKIQSIPAEYFCC